MKLNKSGIIYIFTSVLDFYFDNFPVIETNRLILRQVNPLDVDAIYRLRNEAKTVEFTARPPFESKKEAQDMIEKITHTYETKEGLSWALTIKGDPTMVGGVGFWRIIREHYRAEIGYSILPHLWNQGIMSEAVKEVVAFGFSVLGLHSIEANLHPGNIASIKILEKNGFIKEGYFKENYFFNGRFDDTLTYGKVNPT